MDSKPKSPLARFFELEAAGGILLMFSAVFAIIRANTPLQVYYELLLSTPVEIRVGTAEIAKPLLLWINDGLMAIFFFLVGLELKREVIEGELSELKDIVLPGIGAIGGMLFPALIYIFFNFNDPAAIKGWAIPAATDIAFALGALSLLGSLAFEETGVDLFFDERLGILIGSALSGVLGFFILRKSLGVERSGSKSAP